MPLISICITCFNAEDTIERAIDSALSQDWKNFEIVIIDDGSTDDSVEILKKKSIEHQCIRLITNQNNFGCAYSRNILIDAAKGEFVVFFDDDDISRHDRLSLQYNKIISHEREKNTKLICCYASGGKIYPNGYKTSFQAVGCKGTSPSGLEMADYLLFAKRLPNIFYGSGAPTCALMLRKAVFKKIGYFDDEFNRQEDIDFAVRFGLNGGFFIGISEPVLTQYSTNDQNKKSAKIEFKSSMQLIEKNRNYLLSNNSYYYICLWTKMRYLHFSNQDFRALIILIRLLCLYPIRTVQHFAISATRRFIHEKRMNRNG
tara:strand:- start:194 stop:1141 length:948 start_codon:yes stop_codon:yes gene_type:complete